MEWEVGSLEGRKDTEVQESDVIGGSKVVAVQITVLGFMFDGEEC